MTWDSACQSRVVYYIQKNGRLEEKLSDGDAGHTNSGTEAQIMGDVKRPRLTETVRGAG